MILSAFLICLLAAGCGGGSGSSGGQSSYTYKDQKVSLLAPPQRIVPLSAPLLNMLYAVGGTAAARPDTTSPIPEAAKDLPELGHVQNINMETLVGLKPDLVIGEKDQNSKLVPLLQSSKIPYIIINYDGIEDNVDLLSFMGQISGNTEKAQEVIDTYKKGVDAAVKKSEGYTPARIAVLRATGKSVTAETPQSITASMCAALHMQNIVTESGSINPDAKTVPYSLEQLSSDDPDLVFIVTMGKADEINARMDEEMRSNPAWSAMKAVRNHRIYFLPSDLYLMNPGVRTPEAMEGLLKLAYGE